LSALARPRVLLLGDPALRPDGLERALVRGGFQVTEADLLPGGPPDGPLPECVLATAAGADETLAALLRGLDPAHWRGVPVVALLAEPAPGAVGAALRLGCADVVIAPVDLVELCARVEARLRGQGDVESLRDATVYASTFALSSNWYATTSGIDSSAPVSRLRSVIGLP